MIAESLVKATGRLRLLLVGMVVASLGPLAILGPLAGSSPSLAQAAVPDQAQPAKQNPGVAKDALGSRQAAIGSLRYWDDGLAEMSYYRATDVIYGMPRGYVRVHMVNRQWMDPATGVKTAEAPGSVPVLKLNISEEVPTENYNYRYMTSIFLKRDDLAPFKMSLSSQDWCGMTFKQLRWANDSLEIKSFSYFGDEGDNVWQVAPDAVVFDALFIIARDVAAVGAPRNLNILHSHRSNHQVPPKVEPGVLTPESLGRISTALGDINAVRINLAWKGAPTSFVVEQAPPYRLLRYRVGPLQGELLAVERRMYWDRSKPSSFYPINEAP